ncbi:MAG: hypothetical protein COT71_02525 [Candidatus Andersenbacteria bacterium CG10_big_fil_rev_8_21_14_0_10_54_11]|uniref:Glycosyltransferase family 1 protein n=1 Tax=Candidatus Andersenbacteria bacterium CG10_big_fil_rev_8_21_14_0_10_54_11 TaxID=1974485 RepID=A0A2M6WZ83_9BACT|nr:MAG: hypothetical protein COT71_02525 [Candidatus Andersenbacteria bacterium CG10_big_fil_rev_8_21_14_0_10_54_11]
MVIEKMNDIRPHTDMAEKINKKNLRIVINTTYESAGTKVCVDDLLPRLEAAGHSVERNNWEQYQNFDVALFMSPDANPRRAKHKNPEIVTGIMDPKIATPALRQNLADADFSLVSSLEQRDAIMAYNPNTLIYFMFPNVAARPKVHRHKDKVIIGYHGNREHLLCFYPHISRALDRLSAARSIELWTVYNIKRHGRWTRGLPKKTPVRHIQWTPNIYEQKLAQADIGIVNNAIPASPGLRHRVTRPLTRYLRTQVYPYDQDDTVIRFKYSANPGRIYPFAQLGIPVVADFTSTNGWLLGQDKRGLLAHTQAGWYHALRRLADSPDERQRISDGLRRYIDTSCSIEINFATFNKFLLTQVNHARDATAPAA